MRRIGGQTLSLRCDLANRSSGRRPGPPDTDPSARRWSGRGTDRDRPSVINYTFSGPELLRMISTFLKSIILGPRACVTRLCHTRPWQPGRFSPTTTAMRIL